MGIWSRLGNVINSYINDFGGQTADRFKTYGNPRSGDPDLDAAYDELDDFLNMKNTGGSTRNSENAREYTWQDSRQSFNSAGERSKRANLPPEELRPDFEILGVPFGADEETCKAAYKKLLKIHHPDRHTGHEGNYKKATERSAKINAAWDRIEKWRTNGSIS
ncbi:MAG: J domain-containing protein [Treponema sp.]|jgi:DnaJ-domain-containing protein 1|nr:J domain-containing protein [Treponema sp.]